MIGCYENSTLWICYLNFAQPGMRDQIIQDCCRLITSDLRHNECIRLIACASFTPGRSSSSG